MYSEPRKDNAAQRGTGIFYQALPGVAADGRNIMTLIPVQKINGKYVRSQITKPKTQEAIPPKVVSAPVPVGIKQAVTPITTKQIAGKQVSVGNALPCQFGVAVQGLQQGISFNANPLQTVEPKAFLSGTNIQVQTVSDTQVCSGIKKPLLISSTNSLSSSPSADFKKPLLISSTNNLSSSTSSPIEKLVLISSADSLSSLDSIGIKKPLLVSSANNLSSSLSTRNEKPLLIPSTNSFSSSHSTSVPSVSSKSTVSPSNESSYVSELENLCSSHPTSSSLGPPKSRLKLIPKLSQSPNSPMKWMIEEVGANVDLPRSPSVPSKTSQTLDGGNKFGGLKKGMFVSLSDLATSEKYHQQALVMCDGRLFFAAKNDAVSSSVGSNEKSCQLKNSSWLLQHSGIMAPNEVIDLCSDDNPDDLRQTMQTDPPLEDDNVIFVSYLPPKSTNVPMPETNKSARTSNHVSEGERTTPNRADASHDQLTCCGLDGSSLDRSQNPNDSVMVSTVASHDRDSLMSSQDNFHQQRLDTFEFSPAMESLSHLTSGKSTDKDEISSNAPPVCKLSDHLLRQIFGVTADVRICLQRMNPGSPALGRNQLAQTEPTENNEERTSPLKEHKLFMRYSYIPQDLDRNSRPVDIKRAKRSDEQNSSGEVVASSPHAGNDSVRCSLLKRKTKCASGGSSPKAIFCDLDTGLMVGYVEPIDDDILFSDENDTPSSQDSSGQSPNGARSNTSRMGRARKRTKCPCCVPASLGFALTTRSSRILREDNMDKRSRK
ncbi:uncharacterized protein lrif1 [Festucalex cinctus]